MNLAHPHMAITGGGLEGEVLSVLGGTLKQLTGRQVARLARRGSDRGVRLALNRLAEQGIVETFDAPPAVLYSLNLDHIAAPIAIRLAHLRQQLLDLLKESASAWPTPATHLSIFGSAARADGDEQSEIDLFVVRPGTVDAEDAAWRGQLDALRESVRRWTGNHAGISEVGEAELRELATERPPIVRDLERDAVTLIGKDVAQLLRAARRNARRPQ
jgi:hypothetical protein